MTPSETALTVGFYRSLLAANGDCPEAVGWEGGFQRRRFEVLTRGWELGGASIVDVGCGRGDLWTWLGLQGYHVNYVGMDVVPEFVALTNARLNGHASQSCHVADAHVEPLPQGDYLIASGVFNLDVGGGWRNAWWLETVARMWAAAGRGIAFDCLCVCREPKDPRQVYRDPLSVAKKVLRLGEGHRVSLSHNDPPGNILVQLTKGGNGLPPA